MAIAGIANPTAAIVAIIAIVVGTTVFVVAPASPIAFTCLSGIGDIITFVNNAGGGRYPVFFAC